MIGVGTTAMRFGSRGEKLGTTEDSIKKSGNLLSKSRVGRGGGVASG